MDKSFNVGDYVTITNPSEYDDPNYMIVGIIEFIDHDEELVSIKTVFHQDEDMIGTTESLNYGYPFWEKKIMDIVQF